MDKKVQYSIFLFVFILISLISSQYIYSASKGNSCAYAHFLNAELEKLKDNNGKVIQEYEKAIECDPSSFYLRKELIGLLISQNKIDSARTLLEETLRRFPDEEGLELVLAQIYKSEGKNEKAIRIANRILKVDPKNQRANYLLLTIFLDGKKWEETQKYARKVIELTGDDKKEDLKDVYILIGMEYARVGKFDEGLKYLNKAQEIFPDSPEVHAVLGSFYEGEEKLEEALKEYEKALSLSPFVLALYYRLGEIYSKSDRFDEAISIYEKALQINDKDYLSSINLARIYYEKRDYQKGLQILEDYPAKDFYIDYLLGTFLVRLKRMDEAAENIKKSLQLSPKSYASYLLLVSIYGEQDKKDEALALLNDASEKSLLSKDKLNQLFGIVYAQFKDYEQSINYLRKALQLNPDDDTIVFQLGASYERNKDWFKAVYYMRKAIKINPENPEALNYLGYMFAEKGLNLSEATFLIEKAVEIEPKNGYFVDSLGWVYYQKGLLDKAAEQLNKAVELLKADGEDDSVVREHLGDVYYKQGNLVEAKKHWEISVSLDSTRDEVKKKLETLESKF